MGQLTLNIVALAVFGVTMATVLGPLLHIPQSVPVVAIATLLTLAIVDQASWNGRLGNLLVNGITRLSGESRDRIVHHEAGHFLVAFLLGIPVTDYTLNAWDAWRKGLPGLGGVQFDITALEPPLKNGELPAQLVNRYCTVWMAGIAAEKKQYGDAQGGQDDRQKFSALWQQLQRSPQEAQTRQRWAVLQAQTLLEQHSEAYTALVKAMAEGKTTADCLALLTSHVSQPSPIAEH